MMNNAGATSASSVPEMIQTTGPVISNFPTTENNAAFLSLSAISDLEIAEPEEIAKKLQERCDIHFFDRVVVTTLLKKITRCYSPIFQIGKTRRGS